MGTNMNGKKEQKDDSPNSFRSLKEIVEFTNNYLGEAHKFTPEEEKAFADAKTYEEMTEEDWQKEHEAQNELEQQHKDEVKFNELRKFLHIGIEAKRGEPNSELFQTAKELTDLVNRIEIDPSSVSSYERNKFKTGLIRYKELLKGEAEKRCKEASAEKPAETKQDIPPAKGKKKKAKIASLFKKIFGWIFKKTSHVIGAVIIAIIGGLIVAILVDIFADFGWIERIKAVIYKILQLN